MAGPWERVPSVRTARPPPTSSLTHPGDPRHAHLPKTLTWVTIYSSWPRDAGASPGALPDPVTGRNGKTRC